MEDNNNIDPIVTDNYFPDTVDPKIPPYLELEPENELNFVETDSINVHVHSSSAIDSQPPPSTALFYAFLSVKNVSTDFAVLFKIQTTSPKHYGVKPSHGRIEIGETREIQISMLSESNKSDKFLIKAVPTFHPAESPVDSPTDSPTESPVDSPADSLAYFNSQFSTCPEKFTQKTRLRCIIPGSNVSGLLAATAGGNGSTGSVINISSPVAPSLRNTFIAGAGDSMASINSEKSALIPKSPAASVSSSTASVGTLHRELKEARAEIDRLKAKRVTVSGSSSVAKEWKDVLTAQYGAPPVLILLVAVFAFMVGLLF